jgi:hypothetical protein
MTITYKPGWEVRAEPSPSLNRHFWPIVQEKAHVMSWSCWCRPVLQEEAAYTLVVHEEEG